MDKGQYDRIHQELIAVGVGKVGLHTPEVKQLAHVLHPEEHIGGAVYGKYAGSLAWLVATNHRIIFMDKKPSYMTFDELTYDVVSGVKSTKAGLFTAVTLHTRVNDYTLVYVPAKAVQIFMQYIEKRRLESNGIINPGGQTVQPQFKQISNEGLTFLKTHDLAVLSTVDRTGNIQGAMVYYLVDQNNLIYILTKSGTSKGRNIFAHSQVALTVYEPGAQQTLQLQGTAEVETNQTTKDKVFSQFVQPRSYRGKMEMPPVTKLHEGEFMVIRISPTLIKFTDYTNVL